MENSQLQEELQRMRQHGGGGGGGGGGGQRVRQLQEDNEHLRHQVRTYTCVLLCVYMYVYMRVCLFIVCLFSVYVVTNFYCSICLPASLCTPVKI